ncbi:MAG: HD domain-containing protein [Deltaproteobacteria bacterium]|nr:HD domain-containing protein [Deltaproteobacteria bacterium]
MYDNTFDHFIALLQPLARVHQEPDFHPEGDALFHSLQVFERAKTESDDPEIWAAALLHDVGKTLTISEHAEVGADLLLDSVSARVCWLVEHHMDLVRDPKGSRISLAKNPRAADLLQLRRWDLAGRSPHAWVSPLEAALGELLEPGCAEQWLLRARVRKDGTTY